MILKEITSYDVPENATDISNAFNLIHMPETPLLNSIELAEPAKNTEIKWFDDQRLPIGTKVDTIYQTTANDIVLESVEGLRSGSIFTIDESVYKVISINNDTRAVTVDKLSNDKSHNVGDNVIFIGNARKENSKRQDSDYTPPIERSNVTQIFDDSVVISGSEEAVNKIFSKKSDLNGQVQSKLQRLYLQLGRALWNNPLVKSPNNATERLFGGIDWYLQKYGYCPAALAFNVDNLDSYIYELTKNGFISPEIWINPMMMPHFANLDITKVRKEWNDTNRGTPIVKQYYTKYGHLVSVNMDPNAMPGKIYVMKKDNIKVKNLAGRQFHIKDIDEGNDGKIKRILGEYTTQIQDSALMGYLTIT